MADRQANAIKEKQLAIRNELWPDVEPWLWNRKINHGFTTIPKTMPHILKIMDEMTSGAPVSHVYLSLWCSTWDNCYAVMHRPGEQVYASRFTGQRDKYTWAARMTKLKELHFIDIKPGPGNDMKNVLMLNPHFVIRWHHRERTPGLVAASYNALKELALELGAKDMLEATPLPQAPFETEKAEKDSAEEN